MIIRKINKKIRLFLLLLCANTGYSQSFQPYQYGELINKVKEVEKKGKNFFYWNSDSVVFERSEFYSQGKILKNEDYNIYLYHFSNESNYTFIKGGVKLEMINEFKNEKLFGWSYQIFRDTLKVMTLYSNGLKNGISITQNINTHKTVSIIHFKNDTLNGSNLSFYPNGKLKTKMVYQMGYPIGEYYEYYKSGNLKVFGEFRGGYLCILDNKNGMQEIWYYNGKLINKEKLPDWLLLEIKNSLVPNYNSVYIDKKKWIKYDDE